MGKEENQRIIRIDKDIAGIVDVYCAVNDLKINEFATKLFNEKLKEFKIKVEKLRNEDVAS